MEMDIKQLLSAAASIAAGAAIGVTALTFTGTENLAKIKNNMHNLRLVKEGILNGGSEAIWKLNDEITNNDKHIEVLSEQLETLQKQTVDKNKTVEELNNQIRKANEDVENTKNRTEEMHNDAIRISRELEKELGFRNDYLPEADNADNETPIVD